MVKGREGRERKRGWKEEERVEGGIGGEREREER